MGRYRPPGELSALGELMSTQRHHQDFAHHHPVVQRRGPGRWVWVCGCGGASSRCESAAQPWRLAVLAALNHSATIAA